MLLESPWKPRLADGTGPLYRRIAEAVAQDLLNGKIPPGARLPAHRDLCYVLSVSLGTVTKAYALLERQGLTHSEKGRGTFATRQISSEPEIIDLSENVPPNVLSDRMLSGTLTALATSVDAADFGNYFPPQGTERHRRVFAKWLQQFCRSVSEERLVFCTSAQSALMQIFCAFDREHYALATDNLCYPKLKQMAEALEFDLYGLASDENTILPQALEQLTSQVSKRLIIFSNPALQNPTARTMSKSRMRDIAKLCKKHDLLLIEDDVYGSFADVNRLCFLDLIPERTFYVSGVSKILTPGLRVGAIVPPAEHVEKIVQSVETIGAGASPVSSILLHKWIEDGIAHEVAAQAVREARTRSRLATKILRPVFDQISVCGLHCFLPMTLKAATSFHKEALARGVKLTAPSRAINNEESESGLRICMGGVSQDTLKKALTTLAELEIPSGRAPD